MIGRPHHVAYDCPDPLALARFYAELLGLPVTYVSSDWVVVARSEHDSGFAFQRSPGHRPPTWPDRGSSQQVHLDVMVDDLDTADAAVVALGATRLAGGDHVYADPAGHPFCLVPRPAWAPPVG
ncbi:VOC family protein [Microlunatus flavus]|uniref:Glyoxalase/Bleomycin resistance protein/Dioxygenase superfamily protein n=1 Tax=Microlunatus flavus TaxID=1036181 RepID=A0A1H9HZZ9_9ACTN|nr:VOC family protein [Microlunatus flavus]SEQ67837.1 Glyoxalase/Bleomycin resistance protein/Dioxygenase superfamily protein [Microlunatus flavus]